MSQDQLMKVFFAKYTALARKCKKEQRMLLNHVYIRVEDIDKAEILLEKSFDLGSFLRPGGKTFEGENVISVLWINDEFYLELMQPKTPQKIGYDTGSKNSQPIGHLSEVGFFVPDMDQALKHLGSLGWRVTTAIEDFGARMCKIDNNEVSCFPVELIDAEVDV